MKANWLLGCGFEIFGNTSLSALAGIFFYNIRDDIIFPVTTIPLNRATVTTNRKVRDIQTSFQFLLGLIWGTHFRCNYLGFKVGYEVNVWLNFISLFRLDGNSNRISLNFQNWVRKLAMHGLSASVRLDF